MGTAFPQAACLRAIQSTGTKQVLTLSLDLQPWCPWVRRLLLLPNHCQLRACACDTRQTECSKPELVSGYALARLTRGTVGQSRGTAGWWTRECLGCCRNETYFYILPEWRRVPVLSALVSVSAAALQLKYSRSWTLRHASPK